jgi:DNA processing protein
MPADYKRELLALREFGKIGPKSFQQLLIQFGSPEEILSASAAEISALPRISPEKARAVAECRDRLEEANKMIEALRANDIDLCTILDKDYPERLRQIDDPPYLLYFRGKFPLAENIPTIGIVGTTRPSELGVARAVALGRAIASHEGVVVSGLAKGIDASGHIGALAGQGKSLAVLGSGLNYIYPPENSSLAENLAQNGAVISEYSPFEEVNTGRLLARNRIIVGLSQALILVEESTDTVGTAHAPRRALDLGRPLFVVGNGGPESVWLKRGALPLAGADELELVLKYL